MYMQDKHVDIIMLHVDIDKSHANIIILHVDIIYHAYRGKSMPSNHLHQLYVSNTYHYLFLYQSSFL